jgi:hypothetical protein
MVFDDVKKNKRKRVPVEESLDIALPVGEAKPERKKRRTESKSANISCFDWLYCAD